jgi:hypothetical protein
MADHLPPQARSVDDSWAATRAMTAMPTQLLADKEDYLADVARDIGRRINDEQHELFVVCAPDEALRQQLDHLQPEYIALHDIGSTASRSLLVALAEALRGRVQQLSIRRQGFGITLGTLEFVELAGARGKPPMRIYSTRVDMADASQRHALAHVLLGHSRLGVLLVDDHMPANQGAQDLQRLREAQAGEGWRNAQLLCLPLSAGAAQALSDPASGMVGGRRSRTQVLLAPALASLGQAWPLIQTIWQQMRSGQSPTLPTLPAAAAAPTPASLPGAGTSAPVLASGWENASPERAATAMPPTPRPAALPLRPMPTLGAAPVVPSGPEVAHWSDYVRSCAEIKGLVSCCVFELATQRTLAHAGQRPGPASLASQGAALFYAARVASQALGLPSGEPDLAITVQEHHLLLHPIPGHPGLALHAVLDAHEANLTLARLKLQRIDAPAG